MDTKEIIEEVQSRVAIENVKLMWGFGEISFKSKELLSTLELQDHISEIINKGFVERWVMFYDLTNEDVIRSIQSLREVATFLDTKIQELRGKLSYTSNGLIQILEELRSACITNARKIEEANNNFEEGNRYEIAIDDRIKPHEWLPDYLIELRLSTYPLIKALIDFLPETNLTKKKAIDVWYSGRTQLPESEKDKASPSWNVTSTNSNSDQTTDIEKWWQFWK
jgi:hypothetical protein